MTEVQKIKQALDPELYVKAIARWQEEDRRARYAADKIITLPGHTWPEVPQNPQPPKTQKQAPERADPNLVFSVLLAAFGMFCLVVALIV